MQPLLILGASTRAAAYSALRAGFRPICGDMFADADLRQHAVQVLDVPDYPRHLLESVAAVPANTPWIYTGALENSPLEIERLADVRPLWGNRAAVLSRCRDPWWCHDTWKAGGVGVLDLWPSPAALNRNVTNEHAEMASLKDGPPRDGQWVIKPLRSAAGQGVAVWDGSAEMPDSPCYWQRYAAGIPVSAAFLGTTDGVRLLGISRQLIGLPELYAPAMGYCGSIVATTWEVPQIGAGTRYVESSTDYRQTMERAAAVLQARCALRGLFGIDFIHDSGQIWPLEVNPRYTASMELIELNCRQPLLEMHHRACLGDTLDVFDSAWPPCQHLETEYRAKVILYADRDAVAPDLTALIPLEISLADGPAVADIPVTGVPIYQGQPVLTCLGAGPHAGDLLRELLARARDLWQRFPSR